VLSFLSRSGSSLDEVLTTYFQTFHRSLPILSQEVFYLQLRSYLCGDLEPDSHFALLLLAIFLITHLSSTSQGSLEDGARLYREVKRIWALLHGKKTVALEIVQVGCMLASWEHAHDAGQEAWLTIGTCARIGYILGLHISVKAEPPSEENSEDWEMRRCVWWGIVVLEQSVSSPFLSPWSNFPRKRILFERREEQVLTISKHHQLRVPPQRFAFCLRRDCTRHVPPIITFREDLPAV
jgi:hypothetical protein